MNEKGLQDILKQMNDISKNHKESEKMVKESNYHFFYGGKVFSELPTDPEKVLLYMINQRKQMNPNRYHITDWESKLWYEFNNYGNPTESSLFLELREIAHKIYSQSKRIPTQQEIISEGMCRKKRTLTKKEEKYLVSTFSPDFKRIYEEFIEERKKNRY